MLKEPTQTLDGPALSEEVYHLALERIKALLGCTGDSPEERELIDWATIADAYEYSVHSNDNVLAAPALAARQHTRKPGRVITSLWRARAGPTIPARARETAITGLVELFVETLG